jgi:hypothetical protein
MRRVLVAMLLSVAFVLVGMVPAGAHDSTDLIPAESCTGEQQTAFHVTAAGNLYEDTVNVCVGVPVQGADFWTVEGVVRHRCYRNAAIYDGCRWTSTVETQWKLENIPDWHVHSSVGWCVPCGTPETTGWRTDSGREWAGHLDDHDLMRVRGKSEAGQVRFLLADGTEVLKNMSSVWGPTYAALN